MDDRLQAEFDAMAARFDVLEVAWAQGYARTDLATAKEFEAFLLDRAEQLHVTAPSDAYVRRRAEATIRLANVLAQEISAVERRGR